MTLQTILLAVGPGDADRTEELAETVIEVAAPADATVVLAHVFTQDEYNEVLENLEMDAESDQVRPDEVASRHSTIRKIQQRLDEAGIDYDVRGDIGDHGSTIVELATGVAADRVVVGGRRRSPTGKAVFGSTAQEVLLSSPCPVTFVRSAEDAAED
ncbi:universal stress protein [Natronococcus occultus]|uniref:Universal stress protein UspA-like protein n=1 Tax=Natronococcus occultus SP4 TaxID=694430 RepID=L0JY09_9EURY|nr:universal stress protein [Natronococcus occultus]AGB37917.1 universal stress protein UspA-like protein [Natronococcus occultus SP4]